MEHLKSNEMITLSCSYESVSSHNQSVSSVCDSSRLSTLDSHHQVCQHNAGQDIDSVLKRISGRGRLWMWKASGQHTISGDA